MNLPTSAERAHQAALRSIARVVTETVPPQDPEKARSGILSLLHEGDVLCVTGAGVSTDSGIPDYRGPQGSLHRHRPMTYQEFQHDAAARHRYWARSFVGWRQMHGTAPNRSHELLAQWQSRGMLTGLVTQNVDGLHRQAAEALNPGTAEDIVTLHGDLDTVVCLVCGNSEHRPSLDVRLEEANPGYAEAAWQAAENINPDGDVTLADSWVQEFVMVSCRVCGSQKLKPDVVYFGENVPAERKAAVDRLTDQASALLVVGSSMAVMSGFKIALTMHRAGKPVAVINGGPSRADAKAQWRWRTRITPALEELEQLLSC
ncbi:Sir2 family NAD-dependent protein deacetylase [Nesterenkonia lacusekhoensis]|uniref:protein acetyllysine N-acetyltransferase n=1 Tax=Nesterenkonia lacusekhoensis TaxID=150832 RepID=A0ABS4T4S3_9MICC|nr:Sir2 family NAD-dependent protein deacetylase [Nesterenkonia lacusekhoensis]MBP2319427.1 NAD-dependent SIR2 family protein deacetylase [Nesterenkonia lacusekhoensis]